MNTILVVTQPCVGRDCEINNELISKANELSVDNNATVLTLIMESISQDILRDYSRYGGDKYLICEVDAKRDYVFYSELVVQVCNMYHPALVLYPGTELGKAVSATAAIDLEAALVADCIDIKALEDGEYCFTRAAMNSCIIAQIKCVKECVQMCTIKKNTFHIKELDEYKRPEIQNITYLKPKEESESIHVINRIIDETIQRSRIEDASIIFGVGRGVLPQDIPLVEQIARHYRAEVGCSRYYVEENVMDKAQQIGQSGYCVKADIYIAMGISGASQHMVGVKNVKKIIAINNDENANIMKYADYVMLGDTHEIINAMYSKIIGE